MNRDLDAEIVEKIYNWKPARLGVDYNGENACEVLTQDGQLVSCFTYPPVGIVHRGFHAPQYSADKLLAIELCAHVGFEMKLSEVVTKSAEEISTLAFDYWKSKQPE